MPAAAEAIPELSTASPVRRSFLTRLRGLLPQLWRFGLIGVLGLVVDVGGFNLLRFAGPGGHGVLHQYVLGAKLASSVASMVVAWLGNRYWTFSESRREAKHHEFVAFGIVSVIGIAIALGCLWVSHYVFGFRSVLADNISGNGIGLGLATMFRFWAYRRHVFNNR